MLSPVARILRRKIAPITKQKRAYSLAPIEPLESRQMFAVIGGGGGGVADPTNLTATAVSPTEIDLSWKDNATNEKSYRIDMGLSENGSFITAKTLPANSTHVKLKGLLSFTHYFFRVSASNSFDQSGLIEANASTPVPGAEKVSNNTLAKAQNIGVLAGPGQFQDFVNDADPIDFIRFKVAKSMTFHGELAGQSDSVTMTLSKIGAANALTPIVTQTASTFTFFDQKLAAGNYAISFARTAPGDQTAYHMLLEPDFLGNSPLSATKIGALGAKIKTFTDTVGPSDDADCIKFTLSAKKSINLVLTKFDQQVIVEIHDAGSNQIVFRGETAIGKSKATFHTKKLTAHAWVVVVRSVFDEVDGSFTLGLSAT